MSHDQEPIMTNTAPTPTETPVAPLGEFCASCDQEGACPIAYVGNCLPSWANIYIPRG